jgi:hypothetical protein
MVIVKVITASIGFFLGAISFSNIVLQLLYGLPKAHREVKGKKLQGSMLPKFFISPVGFILIMLFLYAVARHFALGFVFLLGVALGVLFHLIELFTPKGREDLRKEYRDLINYYSKR